MGVREGVKLYNFDGVDDVVTLSPVLAEFLRKAAGGRDLELFLADLLAQSLDPPRRVELYLRLYEKYLADAEELYSKGDLPQAGEKYWGAVTALLNAIAEIRGAPHYSHRDYAELIGQLYEETGDKELVMWFRMAEGLHANFYHNFMKAKEFELHRDAVLKLVERLKGFLAA
ncbi:MAG: PaREP1 family protein [Thermoproteus sp.]